MKFADLPIINAHIHVFWNLPFNERAKLLKQLMDELNYEKVTILTIPYNSTRRSKCRDFTESLNTYYIKNTMPDRVYAFAGLTPSCDKEKNTSDFFLEQLKFYMDAGFDGLKMIEGRPLQRPMCDAFNDPKYHGVYEYLEANQIPLVVHANADKRCWNPGGLFERLGTSHITWLDYYNDLRDVLKKYPKLRLTIAHFNFGSEEYELSKALLDEFENVYYDICPNPYMYVHFAQKEEIWRPFFEQYQDRLIFGTDLGSVPADINGTEARDLDKMVRGFLEGDELFSSVNFPIPPMKMDEDILRKIYKDNVMNFYQHKAPRALNNEVMKKEYDIVWDKYLTYLDVRDRDNMNIFKTIL